MLHSSFPFHLVHAPGVREVMSDVKEPYAIPGKMSLSTLISFLPELVATFSRSVVQVEDDICQRAPKFPQKWASKIPWFGGEVLGR